MLFALCLLSGCASVLVTSLHNQNVQQRARAVQIQADNNGASILFDLLNLEGYMGAWREHPWAMAGATIADLGTGIAAGVAIDKSRSSAEPQPYVDDPAPLPSLDLRTGEGGDINLYQVNGNGNTFGDSNGTRE